MNNEKTILDYLNTRLKIVEEILEIETDKKDKNKNNVIDKVNYGDLNRIKFSLKNEYRKVELITKPYIGERAYIIDTKEREKYFYNLIRDLDLIYDLKKNILNYYFFLNLEPNKEVINIYLKDKYIEVNLELKNNKYIKEELKEVSYNLRVLNYVSNI